MNHLPQDTGALLPALDKMFPARCPKLTETEREIWLYAGRRLLIDELIARQKTEIEGDS